MQNFLGSASLSGTLSSFHAGPTGGHFAADKLFEQVRLRFWWPKMLVQIEQYCKGCPQCGSRNQPVPAPRATLGRLAASEPLEVVALDILSGLPTTAAGHKHLLVVVDHYSRWVECYPLKTQEASEVAKVFVREFVSRFGCPQRIHSDQGGCFVGEVMTITCQLLGIDKSRTTAFHPQSDGICERVNRTVLSMFSKFLEENQHDAWDESLPLLLLGLRSQLHRSLGVSPYCLLFGREPRLPKQLEIVGPIRGRTRSISEYLDELRTNLSALHKLVLEKSAKSHARNKQVYEKKINEFSYSPGSKIYLHRAVVPKGQYYKFLRPWKKGVVVGQVGPLNYRIRLDGAKSTLLVHHNRLKPRADEVGISSVPDVPVSVAGDSERQIQVATEGQHAVGVVGDLVSGEAQCSGLSDSGRSADSITVPVEPPAPIATLLSPFALAFIPRSARSAGGVSVDGGGQPAAESVVIDSGGSGSVPIPTPDRPAAESAVLDIVENRNSPVPTPRRSPVHSAAESAVLDVVESRNSPVPTLRRSVRATRGCPPQRLIEE